MKSSDTHIKASRLFPAIVALVAATVLSTMAPAAFSRAGMATSVTIRNNSQREIRHVYVAVGDPNNWSSDQLGGSSISSGGGSFVLNDVACSGSGVRVIAEDHNGCFVYFNAACDTNQTWEITDSTAPDCDG